MATRNTASDQRWFAFGQGGAFGGRIGPWRRQNLSRELDSPVGHQHARRHTRHPYCQQRGATRYQKQGGAPEATALLHADAQSQQVWRIDLLPWNEHRPEAFAGLHNQGKRIVVIMDEASVIPPIIWQTIEPVMTDVNTEIVWAVFGNPLHPTGPFRECFGRFAHRWQR